jgi:putative aminopeptidase FrvX
MDIKDTFIELVRTTIPHGYESSLLHLFPTYEIDPFGNIFIKVGDDLPSVLFTSHLDTFSKGEPETIKHKISKDFIKTNGKTILGADDKAGVTILLSMIENQIPGLYYFFVGEEIGRLGSRFAVESDEFKKYGKRIKNVISFDRKGYDSIITHQSNVRTCSDNFAIKLKDALNKEGLKMNLDNKGVNTDSFSFVDYKRIENCTNISVGYFNHHSHSEKQDLGFLELLSKASCKIDWDSL